MVAGTVIPSKTIVTNHVASVASVASGIEILSHKQQHVI